MAICKICKQDMLTADSCICAELKFKNKKYRRIRFGEIDDMSSKFNIDANATCGDCGCHVGGLHHWGCDMETCPVCKQQLLSCECDVVIEIKN